MCSSIIMENYQGDLTDIVRASGSGGGAYGVVIGSTTTSSSSELPSSTTISTTTSHHHHHHNNYLSWHQQQHLSSSDPMNFSSVVLEASTNFGDPFSTMRDPFLQELLMPSGSPYFSSSSGGLEEAAASFGAPGGNISTSTSGTSNSASSVFGGHKINNVEEHNDMRRPCKNIFSNMIQISPSAKLPYDSQPMAPSPRPIRPSALLSPNMASKDSLLDTSGLQISSPRNPGLKRRKNLAKKVVCIPAPAVANSRQTGEVVPSDLWAWRKYGQKPIKGSPYPRGYYRCSSSKGCSARKQVERSRTDPNMLVITYTSEHNHPWPTQRNALAGSARSQPSKNNNNNNNNASNSKNSSESNQKGTTTTTKAKEEQHQEMSNNTSEGNVSPVGNSVKEENMEEIEKQLEIEMEEGEFSDGLPYKPCMMDQSNNNSEDFFAELGEIEADPLHLLFTQGFGAADDHHRESKALDPFHLFDWSGDTNNNSFEEPNKRRL